MAATNKSEQRIPLSGDQVVTMLLLSTCIASEGSKLTISGRWKVSSGTHWLQVNQSGGTGEVCVRWLCKRYEGIYVVLEPASSALNREMEPQYAIAEVVNKNTLRLLDPAEIETALPHIQAEIVGRNIWPHEKKLEVLFTDMQSVFGDFPPPNR
ncbi:MAG: hypothetical protein K2W95_26445 [Candidatus Obscuribacterales bacterium]|nr:hypothetical protein [Candidatus Obscuribacterales bacterium]